MYCARCGAAITSPAAFCSNCGAPLPAMTPAGAAAGTAPVAAPWPGPAAAAAAAAVAAPAEYAGFWRRFWALCLDAIVVSIAMLPVRLIVAGSTLPEAFSGDMTPETIMSIFAAGAAGLFFSAFLQWIYFAYMESSAKQATLGKMALGIRVTDLEGRRLTFGRATGRYFAHWLTALTLLIGYLIQPFTDRRQALHDMIAKTLVLRGPAA